MAVCTHTTMRWREKLPSRLFSIDHMKGSKYRFRH